MIINILFSFWGFLQLNNLDKVHKKIVLTSRRHTDKDEQGNGWYYDMQMFRVLGDIMIGGCSGYWVVLRYHIIIPPNTEDQGIGWYCFLPNLQTVTAVVVILPQTPSWCRKPNLIRMIPIPYDFNQNNENFHTYCKTTRNSRWPGRDWWSVNKTIGPGDSLLPQRKTSHCPPRGPCRISQAGLPLDFLIRAHMWHGLKEGPLRPGWERKIERERESLLSGDSRSITLRAPVGKCGRMWCSGWKSVVHCGRMLHPGTWGSGAVWQWVRSVAVVAARAKRHFPPCGHLQTRLHTSSPALIYWRMLRNTQRYWHRLTEWASEQGVICRPADTNQKYNWVGCSTSERNFLSPCNTRNTQVHWYEGTDSLQRIEGLLRCKIVALKHHQLHKCYRRRRPMVSCYNHAEAKKYQILLRYKKTSNHAEAKKIKSCRGLSKVPQLLSLENDAFIVEGMTSIMWGC